MSEGSVPVDTATPGLPDALAGARVALTKHDWIGAFDGFTKAESQTPLAGADLESLAQAAFFTGSGDAQLEAEERAFHAYLGAGDPDRAAYIAIDLAQTNYFKGKPSIATAWFRRAEKLLDGKPESYAQGYLELARSFLARSSGNIEAALASAEKAIEIGFRATDADLQASGQIALGGLKISTGATADVA